MIPVQERKHLEQLEEEELRARKAEEIAKAKAAKEAASAAGEKAQAAAAEKARAGEEAKAAEAAAEAASQKAQEAAEAEKQAREQAGKCRLLQLKMCSESVSFTEASRAALDAAAAEKQRLATESVKTQEEISRLEAAKEATADAVGMTLYQSLIPLIELCGAVMAKAETKTACNADPSAPDCASAKQKYEALKYVALHLNMHRHQPVVSQD